MSLDRKRVYAGLWALAGIIAAIAAAQPARAAALEFCVVCNNPDTVYRCTFDDAGASRKAGLQLHCISTLAREGAHESCTIERNRTGPCTGTLKTLALPAGAAPNSVPETAEREGQGPAHEPAPPGVAAAPEPIPAGQVPAPPPAAQAPAQPVSDEPAPAKPSAQPGSTATWSDKSGGPGTAGGDTAAGAEGGNAQRDGQPETQPEKPLESATKAVGDAAKSTGEALKKAGSAVGNAAKKSWDCLTSLFDDC